MKNETKMKKNYYASGHRRRIRGWLASKIKIHEVLKYYSYTLQLHTRRKATNFEVRTSEVLY